MDRHYGVLWVDALFYISSIIHELNFRAVPSVKDTKYASKVKVLFLEDP